MPWQFEDELQQQSNSAGNGWVFEDELQQPEESTAKSTLRSAAQVPLGYAAKYTFPADIASLATQGATRGAFEEGEAMEDARRLSPQDFHPQITEEEKQKYIGQVAENFPTQRNLERIIEEKTGLPLQSKTGLQKSLRLGGEAAGFTTGKPLEKALRGVAAPAISKTLQESQLNAPEEVADLAGLVASGTPIPSLRKAEKIVPKFSSGLSKPAAVESKIAKYGKIPKEVKEATIKGLNEEAAKISEKILEKERPIIRQINEGKDLDSEFQQGFSALRQSAKKYNPELNINPVSSLMEKTRVDLGGLPNPSKQTRKILKEAEAFSRNPPITLYDNLRNFRDLSKKQNEIYEKAHIFGKQKEYADFISNYKKSITQAIEESFPKDAEWVKQFKELNQNYSEYLNTKKAQSILSPILGKEPTVSQLEKYVKDPKIRKNLSMSLGQKGSDEIVQLVGDLTKARESISKIPVKEIDMLEKSLPYGYILSDFIPVFGKALKIPIYAKAAKGAAQSMIGSYLVNPKSRKAYSLVIKEFNNRNSEAFGKAVRALIKIQQEESPIEPHD